MMNAIMAAIDLNKYGNSKIWLIVGAVALVAYIVFSKLTSGKGDAYEFGGDSSDN